MKSGLISESNFVIFHLIAHESLFGNYSESLLYVHRICRRTRTAPYPYRTLSYPYRTVPYLTVPVSNRTVSVPNRTVLNRTVPNRTVLYRTPAYLNRTIFRTQTVLFSVLEPYYFRIYVGRGFS